MRKIPLQFSDIDFGTEEFGFIPVERGEDPDDADARYLKHLAAQGVRGSIDRMGNLVVEGPLRRGTLRLTEGQLRQIIRQEVRSLRESAGDDWSAPDPMELNMMELSGDAITRIKRGDRPAQVFALVMGGLKKLGVDPYDGLPDIIGRIRGAEGLRSFADQLESMAMDRGY